MPQHESEIVWLRPRVIRMRALLRYAKSPQVEADLRELIADAESRLEFLEERERTKGALHQKQDITSPAAAAGASCSRPAELGLGPVAADHRFDVLDALRSQRQPYVSMASMLRLASGSWNDSASSRHF